MISIIIVNYNSGQLIQNCIRSIYNQKYKNFEVIVVDNASKDNSTYDIEDNFPKVKLIRNKINYGFAKGNNIGIKASKGEYILFVNPDTEMEDENFLSEIIKPMKHPYIGSVAPTIMRLEPDHSFVKIDSMGIMVPKNGLGRDITRVEDLPNIIAACGACMLYRRETLEDIKVNGEYFDEDFFAYCEDTDLGMRSMLRGWAINSSKCYINHVHSASMKSAPGYIQLLGHRNNILTVIKNYPKKTLIKHLPSIIFWQFASIGVWFARMKPFLILKLKYDAIKLIPKMLQKRKIIQSRSKVDDFEEYLS